MLRRPRNFRLELVHPVIPVASSRRRPSGGMYPGSPPARPPLPRCVVALLRAPGRSLLSYPKAIPNQLVSVHDDPSQAGRYRFLAACYAHLGRLDEAGETVKRLRAITSAVMPPVDSFLRNA